MADPLTADRSAARYHKLRLRLYFVAFLSELLFFAWAIGSGFSSFLWQHTRHHLLFLALFFALNSLWLFPLDLVRAFILEKKFQLSTQTLTAWLFDYLKSFLLSVALFLATYSLFYWLLAVSPQSWWLWASLISCVFSILMNILFPIWLIPLFYKMTPLTDPLLNSEITQACQRSRVPVMRAYEIKLSQKTKRANAAVVGFGKTRRVILSDTLLEAFSPEEIRMVVSHEIGHHAKKHIGKTTAIFSLVALSGFWAIHLIFPVATLSDPVFLPILLLVSHVAQFLSTPLISALSRRHEREADVYALSLEPDLPVFESLMTKLSAKNLSNPNPSALEEWFFYTHPSAKNRIQAAKQFLADSTHAAKPGF